MKLSITAIIFAMFMAVVTTTNADSTAYTVVIAPKDVETYSDTACGEEDNQLISEMMDEIIYGNLREEEIDESHRQLYYRGSYCNDLCGTWFLYGNCFWAYPFCWPRRRSLRVGTAPENEQFLDITPDEDHTPECAQMVVAAEEGMNKIAATTTSETCKNMLLAEKNYHCYKL